MRHLDRFRNWLGDIYNACLRFRSHFGADNSGGADEPTVEKQQRHEIAADVTQLESVSSAPKQTSNQQTETVQSANGSGNNQLVQATNPPASKKMVREAKFTDQEYTVASPELQRIIATAKKNAFPQQKRVASQPPAVTEPQPPASQKAPESSRQAEVKVVAGESQPVKSIKAEIPKRQLEDNLVAIAEVKEAVASAGLEQERTNGSGSTIRSARDKYSPGTITDQTAQRLARLLISEIKLYNKVADSTANNVYDILKDPIDKARKYYGQRLGPTAIASMPDYFHAELVRTLCAGDASRLGPNYKS